MTANAALKSAHAARASVRARADGRGTQASRSAGPAPWEDSLPLLDEALSDVHGAGAVGAEGPDMRAAAPGGRGDAAGRSAAPRGAPRSPRGAPGSSGAGAGPGPAGGGLPAAGTAASAGTGSTGSARAAASTAGVARRGDDTVAPAFDLRLMHMASRALVGLALLALLVWGLVWLARGPWFAFKRLTVQGELTHNSVASLRNQVLVQLHGGYFTLDLQVARAAFETAPWVRQAQVRRVWPDQLVVRLEEHQPRAVWERDDDEDQLVNTRGEVFDGNADDLDDSLAASLPVLHGPKGSAPQMLAMHARLVPVFTPMGAEVKRLELSERGSWRAVLANASVLELGRGEPAEVEQRTRRFVASVSEVSAKLGHRAVESADLRHREGYALKLVGVGTREAVRRGAPAAKSR
jgi:cell division protein FtsQ